MKFKPFFLVLLFLIHLSFVINLNEKDVITNPPKVEKDKEANKLLKEVSKKYKDYKSLKSDFTMLNEPADEKAKKTTEKGSLTTKLDKFKLVFGGQEIFCNGKFIWTYTAENNECVKDNYNPNSGKGISPAKIFSIWEKGFLYVSDGTYKKGTSTISKIKLTPTDKTVPYFLMNLEVDKTLKTLQSMKISFKAGNKQTYTINSQTPNTTIADNFFEFDVTKYKDVEIIDLTVKKKK